MKKFLSIIAVVFLAVAISACCGGGQNDQKAKKDACCAHEHGHGHSHDGKKEKSCCAEKDGKSPCCAEKKAKSCSASDSCCKKNKKVVITAYVEVKADKLDKFLGGVNDVLAKSKAEEGNLSYNLFADLKDKHKFVFVEEWKCQAAVDTHFATEHFKSFGALLDEVAAAPASIKIFTVAAEK